MIRPGLAVRVDPVRLLSLPPAGPRLLLQKFKFFRVVFVFSALASDSTAAGPRLLSPKSKFVRVVFVFSAVANDSTLAGVSGVSGGKGERWKRKRERAFSSPPSPLPHQKSRLP